MTPESWMLSIGMAKSQVRIVNDYLAEEYDRIQTEFELSTLYEHNPAVFDNLNISANDFRCLHTHLVALSRVQLSELSFEDVMLVLTNANFKYVPFIDTVSGKVLNSLTSSSKLEALMFTSYPESHVPALYGFICELRDLGVSRHMLIKKEASGFGLKHFSSNSEPIMVDLTNDIDNVTINDTSNGKCYHTAVKVEKISGSDDMLVKGVDEGDGDDLQSITTLVSATTICAVVPDNIGPHNKAAKRQRLGPTVSQPAETVTLEVSHHAVPSEVSINTLSLAQAQFKSTGSNSNSDLVLPQHECASLLDDIDVDLLSNLLLDDGDSSSDFDSYDDCDELGRNCMHIGPPRSMMDVEETTDSSSSESTSKPASNGLVGDLNVEYELMKHGDDVHEEHVLTFIRTELATKLPVVLCDDTLGVLLDVALRVLYMVSKCVSNHAAVGEYLIRSGAIERIVKTILQKSYRRVNIRHNGFCILENICKYGQYQLVILSYGTVRALVKTHNLDCRLSGAYHNLHILAVLCSQKPPPNNADLCMILKLARSVSGSTLSKQIDGKVAYHWAELIECVTVIAPILVVDAEYALLPAIIRLLKVKSVGMATVRRILHALVNVSRVCPSKVYEVLNEDERLAKRLCELCTESSRRSTDCDVIESVVRIMHTMCDSQLHAQWLIESGLLILFVNTMFPIAEYHIDRKVLVLHTICSYCQIAMPSQIDYFIMIGGLVNVFKSALVLWKNNTEVLKEIVSALDAVFVAIQSIPVASRIYKLKITQSDLVNTLVKISDGIHGHENAGLYGHIINLAEELCAYEQVN